MAASTNKAQVFAPIRSLLRGTPTLRIGAKQAITSAQVSRDLNLGSVRRDLHRFPAKWAFEPGSQVRFTVALDPTGSTGGGSVISVLNPWNARVLVTQMVLDVTTRTAAHTETWQLGHGSTATTSDATLIAAANTAIQTVAATTIAPVTATGVIVPAADFFVAQASAILTGIVANLHVQAYIL